MGGGGAGELWENGIARQSVQAEGRAVDLRIAIVDDEGSDRAALAALCAALRLAFARTLLVKLPALMAQEAIGRTWGWLAPAPFIATVALYWMVPWDLSLVLLGRAYQIYLAVTAFVPVVVWVLLHIAWRVMSDVIEAGRLRQEVTLLRMEERRLADLRGYVDQTRELRHDFRHHLLVLSALADEGKEDELRSYLGQLTVNEVTPRAVGVKVRNPIAVDFKLGENGLPATDRPGHGVGLASVRSVAERYGGMLDVRVEGDEFLAGVVLYHA